MSFEFHLRVYYEDTDWAGIVYYANYFRFIERARTEYLRSLGIEQAALRARSGLVFTVRRVVAEFLSPARFDDELRVVTRVARITPARLELEQDIFRNEQQLFASQVMLACINADGRATRIPAGIAAAFAADGQEKGEAGSRLLPGPGRHRGPHCQ